MLLLKNCTYIDWEDLSFSKGHLLVEPGVKGEIKLIQELPTSLSDYQVVECTGKYVTKSFGNSHNHSYSSLCLGKPKPAKEYLNFYEILKNHWWKLDKGLTLDIIKASAYLTAINCAKNGVTFTLDLHSSPNVVEGSLQTIADAFNDVGISHLLSYELSDRDGLQIANKGLKETQEYLSNNQGLLGMHASFTLTNSTLKKAAALAKELDVGINVHVAEDLYDQENCYDIHNKRVVERFADYGILEMDKSVFANCLYLTNNERKLLRESKIYIAQNSESNLINNVGEFNSCLLSNNILLGTDGLHNDLMRSTRFTFYSNQPNDNISKENAYTRLRNFHRYIAHCKAEGDAANNLVVFDYKPGTPLHQDNFIDHFIDGMSSANISDVISDGKIIVGDRKLTEINEAETLAFAQKMSEKLWQSL